MATTIMKTQDPDQDVDLESLIAEVVAEPDQWKKSPNGQLGGLKPEDLLGTPEEIRVRELLRAIKHGMPT